MAGVASVGNVVSGPESVGFLWGRRLLASCGRAPWVLGGTSCVLLVLLYELALGKIVFMLMASMVTEKKTNRSEELAVHGPKPQLSLLETLCTAMKSPAAGSFWKYSCSNALTSSSVLLFRL